MVKQNLSGLAPEDIVRCRIHGPQRKDTDHHKILSTVGGVLPVHGCHACHAIGHREQRAELRREFRPAKEALRTQALTYLGVDLAHE